MIVQSTEMSPNQRASIERRVGRELQDQQNIVLSGGAPRMSSAANRQLAADQMRHQLYLLDRSQHRMSIEDSMAAILEQSAPN
jgi:50S ribosomal subunit-associated GTPase HflX